MRSVSSLIAEKLKSTQQTPANKASPRMSIQVSRARATIMDSDYWTVETIRETTGLGDLSVAPRRFKPYGPPNRLYEIHVANGMISTAIREYPDTFKDGWKDQFSVGNGSSVALAFDGNWQQYRGAWRLVTDEKPWMFWVDDENKLYIQIWDEEETKLKLAEDVVKVRAMRGWKNATILSHDHGLVALYIKTDGKVYYRNYAYLETISEYAWDIERQVTEFEETAVNINLFLTNDYRLGIVMEDDSHAIHWLVTKRNWAGIAIAPNHIIARIADATVDFIPIKYHKGYADGEYIASTISKAEVTLIWGKPDNKFERVHNVPTTKINDEDEEYDDWGFVLMVEVQHDGFYDIDVNDFSLVDSNNRTFLVGSTERINGYVYKLDTENFNNAVGDMTLKFLGSGNTKGGIGQNLDTFEYAFAPGNLVPTRLPLPEVEVLWNE